MSGLTSSEVCLNTVIVAFLCSVIIFYISICDKSEFQREDSGSALVAHSFGEMLKIMDASSDASTKFDLKINIKKTEGLH